MIVEEPIEPYGLGFLMMPRAIFNDPLWTEKRKFNQFEAFTYIVMKANWKDGKAYSGPRLVEVKRGQLWTSMVDLCMVFRWSNSKLKSFLVSLQLDGKIEYKTTTKYTIITVCKYDVYSGSSLSETYQINNRNISKAYQKHTIEERNKEIKEKDSAYPFEAFWQLYDRKEDRPKCEKKWEGINETDRRKIFEYIPLYKKQKPDKQYRKHPATFLNNRSWENEIIATKEFLAAPVVEMTPDMQRMVEQRKRMQ